MKPSTRFEGLDKNKHHRTDFDCGNNVLNTFLLQFAVKHQKAGISKTMVLPSLPLDDSKPEICAFYTLTHTEIERQNLPAKEAKKLPRYPIPVLLIAQLAVHTKCQGQGLGKVTLIRALQHCLEINEHLPSYAVVVDALEGKESFYENYGFSSLTTHQGHTRLFIPMKTILKLFS